MATVQNDQRVDAIVPEALLACSKDMRYHDEFKQIISQVLSVSSDWWFPSSSTSSIDRAIDRLSTLISSCLLIAVIIRKGRTFGMEAAGVVFDTEYRHWKIVLAHILTVIGVHAFQHQRDQDLSLVTTTASGDETMPSPERLKGQDRRLFFEQQRKAMFDRAARADRSDRATSNALPRRNTTPPAFSPIQVSPLIRRVRVLCREVLNLIIEPGYLLGNIGDGPHGVTDSQQTRLDSLSIFRWVIRLNLALYCLNGRYASWMHRICGLTLKRELGNRHSGGLVNRPSQYRQVGQLILLQLLGVIVPSVAFRLIERIIPPIAERQTVASAGIRFENRLSQVRNSHDVSGAPSLARQSSSSSTTCSICHNHRMNPSCPATCGHVFCWKCLQQWVSSIRQECPFCRSPCRPQDIIMLYNYRGPVTSG